MRLVLLLSLCLAGVASAQPKSEPSFPRGQKLVRDYFEHQVRDIESKCLANLTTKEAWEKERPERKKQFFDMLGLWPLPPRTDLKATITGTVEGEGYTVEKLHFQSMPGLYVTANFYLPKGHDRTKKLPTILYVCGHGNIVIDNVSYGSKVSYQYHPAWFATHGYACLILDTHQLHEIPGIHHGTYRYGMWWWHNRGYTPAGIECWNAMRALDYLETRPEVDAKRFGLTGRSGGGATSWYVAAADERIQAAVPVAGICDLRAHLVQGENKDFPEGVIAGHCDCMFLVNSRRWDFADVVALCAPRPVMLGNSDNDRIFPVPGYRRLADKARKVYALYGAEEKFQLLETKGPHVDTPELRKGINTWMNHWLKDDTTTKVADDLPPKLKPQDLKVLTKRPEDAVNETIQELHLKPAVLELPQSPKVAKEWWASKRPELMKALEQDVFRGWPKSPPPLKPVVSADVTHDGVRLRGVDFISEEGVELRLFVFTLEKAKRIDSIMLDVLGTDEHWRRLSNWFGKEYADALLIDPETVKPMTPPNLVPFEKLLGNSHCMAFLCPRGVGPTRWATPGSRDDTQVQRRFPLVGQTLAGQQVWDVRRAIQVLNGLEDVSATKFIVRGEQHAAGLAVYAALFEPCVSRVSVIDPPGSHNEGPILLNVTRHLDLPQATALLFPRSVNLRGVKPTDKKAWDWLKQLAKATGSELNYYEPDSK